MKLDVRSCSAGDDRIERSHAARLPHGAVGGRRATTVLIAGPTGTGKELVARALHSLSPRSAKPFVVVNCAAIPEALLESELFGYTRGAFTGAVQSQLGRIPAAHSGTLFLDEVSELPLGMQAKLLRFLEQKEIQRLGTSEVTRVDVRVMAASNVDLAGAGGARGISPGPFLPALGFSHRVAAARRAPRRHRSPGGTFFDVHGRGHGDAMSRPEPGREPDSAGASVAGKCARTAARNGAGFHSVENGNTIEAEHLYFSGSEAAAI